MNSKIITTTINHTEHSVTVYFTSRKTIALQIDRNSNISVRAPRRTTLRVIRNMLQKKESWITKHVIQQKQKADRVPSLTFQQGSTVLYLGKEVPLEIITRNTTESVIPTDKKMIIVMRDTEAASVKKIFEEWYTQEATELLSEMLAKCYSELPFKAPQYTRFRLSKAKSSWGTCTSKKVIGLNRALLSVPPECIRYVINHELCHLREMNHGKRFYALLEQIEPHWKERKKVLKQFGSVLDVKKVD